ncbi:hypothetical protein HJFPF1_04712 [Paramyrothecium foliicola]|nr:hypothetical protein HJFPF1_04712 [Paramyrothecium foliicola]
MRFLDRWSPVVALATAFYSIGSQAMDHKRLDGIHRVEKKAQITAPAQLQARAGDAALSSCATSLTLCPSDMGGGCCPDGYQCAAESCYATTKGPSTCGNKVGWYACAAVYGGGCCPDGLRCEGGDACVPPTGASFTYSCPASQYLCPSSVNYGCCPNGMGCAPNQCYSTNPETITTRMVITTTRNGDETTITTTRTSVRTPTVPTALPTVDSNQNDGQVVLKFFPSSVAKVSAEAAPEEVNDDQGLSKGALGGIVAGAIIFLIIVLVAAWLILRRLNKVAQAIKAPKPPSAPRNKPQMAQTRYQPTESEIDGVSIDPLMVSPPASVSPRHFRSGQPTPDYSVRSQTPSSFAGGYQAVSPGENAQPTYDMSGNIIGYFDHPPMKPRRAPSTTAPSMPRVSEDSQSTFAHGRQWSNASETSDQDVSMAARAKIPPRELEGDPYVPELVGSPRSAMVSPLDETDAAFSLLQPLHVTRKKSNNMGPTRSETTGGPSNYLGIVDEETSGFQGMSYSITGHPAYQPVTQGSDEHEEYRDDPTKHRR